MKKIFLLFSLILFTVISFAQVEISPYNWSFMSVDHPFDGILKSAFVVGTSDDPYTQSPILSVTKQNNNSERVYLSYVPRSIKTVDLYMRFDNESTIYITNLIYDIRNRRYEINFDLFSGIRLNTFIKELHEHQVIHMRLVNEYMIIDIDFTLNEFQKNYKKF